MSEQPAPGVGVQPRPNLPPATGEIQLPGTAVLAEPGPVGGRQDPMAVAALICGVVALAPIAVVLGVVALVRTRRSGDRGRRLAITGIALGVLWMVAVGLVVAGTIVVGQRVVSSVGDGLAAVDPGPAGRDEGVSTPLSQTQPGQCFSDWDRAAARAGGDPDVVVTPCASAHRAEAFALLDISVDYPLGAAFPGPEALTTAATQACADQLPAGGTDTPARVEVVGVAPTEAAFVAGAREVTCVLVADRDLTSAISG